VQVARLTTPGFAQLTAHVLSGIFSVFITLKHDERRSTCDFNWMLPVPPSAEDDERRGGEGPGMTICDQKYCDAYLCLLGRTVQLASPHPEFSHLTLRLLSGNFSAWN